jgi:hypothetical protein
MSKGDKYTDPELREEIKEEIKASDKGGNKGQWSARKSQLLTQEYEKRGGGYKGEKDESQKNLEKWTEEEWQTQEGDAQARGGDGETARYLPKEAWEKLSDDEKGATENKKRDGSRQGQQHVANTDEARQARKGPQAPPLEEYDDLSVEVVAKKGFCGNAGDPHRPVADRTARAGAAGLRGPVLAVRSSAIASSAHHHGSERCQRRLTSNALSRRYLAITADRTSSMSLSGHCLGSVGK